MVLNSCWTKISLETNCIDVDILVIIIIEKCEWTVPSYGSVISFIDVGLHAIAAF